MKETCSNLGFVSAKCRYIALLAVMFPLLALAQSVNIHGTVTDAATGEEVIGATVKVRGVAGGTITDAMGEYKISASVGQTLEISYIGYTTAAVKIVAGQTTYNVALKEDSESLEEVVVVGYGTMKKSDLSGSSSSINEQALKGTVITSLDQSLQGHATGVTAVTTSGAPGSSSSIRVRGM